MNPPNINNIKWISVKEETPNRFDRVLVWHNKSLIPAYGMCVQPNHWIIESEELTILRTWEDDCKDIEVTHFAYLNNGQKPKCKWVSSEDWCRID